MSDTLVVKKREKVGTSVNTSPAWRRADSRQSVRSRRSQCLAVGAQPTRSLAVIKHGGKLVKLSGDITETAVLREVQWDTYSKDIIHIDLLRVSEKGTRRDHGRCRAQGYGSQASAKVACCSLCCTNSTSNARPFRFPKSCTPISTTCTWARPFTPAMLRCRKEPSSRQIRTWSIVSCIAPHKDEEVAEGLEGYGRARAHPQGKGRRGSCRVSIFAAMYSRSFCVG
jgi:large subunit ribosomal protein L25